MYTRPIEPTHRRGSKKRFAKHARGARREHRRVQGRLQLRRDRRAVRPPVRGQARARCRRASTATSPATSRWRTGSSPPAQQAKLPMLLRVVPDHAGVRHPARAVEAQELRREDAAGRGRDRGRRRRDRRRVRGQPRRSPPRAVPGVDLKSEAHRPRDQPRAAAAHRRRAARRSVHRPADQDRAGRPAARDVRPSRRGAAADRRRAVAEPTASTPRSRRCASR